MTYYRRNITDKFESSLNLRIDDEKLNNLFKEFCEHNNLDQEEMYYFFYQWMAQCGKGNTTEAQELKRALQYTKLKDTGEYAKWREGKEDKKRREEMLKRHAQNWARKNRAYYHEPYYRLFHGIQLRKRRLKDLNDIDKQRAKTLIKKGAIKESKLLGVLKAVDITKIPDVEMSEALTTSAVHNPPPNRFGSTGKRFEI